MVVFCSYYAGSCHHLRYRIDGLSKQQDGKKHRNATSIPPPPAPTASGDDQQPHRRGDTRATTSTGSSTTSIFYKFLTNPQTGPPPTFVMQLLAVLLCLQCVRFFFFFKFNFIILAVQSAGLSAEFYNFENNIQYLFSKSERMLFTAFFKSLILLKQRRNLL